MYSCWLAVQHPSKLFEVSSVCWDTFYDSFDQRTLKLSEAMQRFWRFLQRWEFAGVVLLSCPTCVHTPQLSCNPTHGNIMGSDTVTVVANSVHHHDQSIGLGIYDSDTALWPEWNEVVLRHAGNTSVVVFVEKHSLTVLAVHLAKNWRKYHLSDIAGKCTAQSVDHQWHHTTHLQKSDVGSCFQQLHVDYHNPIHRSFFYCWHHWG